MAAVGTRCATCGMRRAANRGVGRSYTTARSAEVGLGRMCEQQSRRQAEAATAAAVATSDKRLES